jgi:hypothetical protein
MRCDEAYGAAVCYVEVVQVTTSTKLLLNLMYGGGKLVGLGMDGMDG